MHVIGAKGLIGSVRSLSHLLYRIGPIGLITFVLKCSFSLKVVQLFEQFFLQNKIPIYKYFNYFYFMRKLYFLRERYQFKVDRSDHILCQIIPIFYFQMSVYL
jgi:hypothetical protein